MEKKKAKCVWFTEEQQDVYAKLKKKGMTARSFPEFVRGAYYTQAEKIDADNRKEMSPKHIERLAFEAVKKHAQALHNPVKR